LIHIIVDRSSKIIKLGSSPVLPTQNKKGFVIPTKSFVKIWIAKIFVTTTKCLVLSTKRLVAAAKFLVEATKNSFVVPYFVAVTKPFFSVKG